MKLKLLQSQRNDRNGISSDKTQVIQASSFSNGGAQKFGEEKVSWLADEEENKERESEIAIYRFSLFFKAKITILTLLLV